MAQMSQADVDAWIAAHGGRDLQHGVEQKQVKNPSYNPDKGPTPTNQEYMTVEVETWKNSKTNASFSAKHMPDGSWDRYDAVDADPNKPPTGKTPDEIANTQATTAHTQATTSATIKEEAEKDANAAAGRGRLTDQQWTAELGRKETAARTAGQQDLANQIAKDRLAFDKEKDGRPEVKVEQKDVNGQPYFVQTTVSKDGKTPPVIKTYDGNGKEVPGGLPGVTPPPAEAGSFTPDRNKQAGGLIEHIQKLAELRAKNKLTDVQYAAAVTEAHAIAKAAAGQWDAEVSAQQNAATSLVQQRGQDINASTSRLGYANQATKDAFDTSMKYAAAMTPKGMAGAGPILPAIMALQDSRAMGWGGMNQPPLITTGQFPAWNQLAHAGGPGSNVAAVNAATAAAPTVPNALGLGAGIGTQSAPPGGVPGAAPMGANPPSGDAQVGNPGMPPPTAGERGGPPLAPGPVLGSPAASDATARSSKPMIRVDLGDEYVYYDPTPEMTSAAQITPGSALVDVPSDRPNAYREPKTGNSATNMKPGAPPPAPTNNAPFQDEQSQPGTGAAGNPDYQPGLPPGSSIVPQQSAIPQENLVPDGRTPAWQQPQSMMQPNQTLPAFGAMHPGIHTVLGQQPGNQQWQMAVMEAARQLGLA